MNNWDSVFSCNKRKNLSFLVVDLEEMVDVLFTLVDETEIWPILLSKQVTNLIKIYLKYKSTSGIF